MVFVVGRAGRARLGEVSWLWEEEEEEFSGRVEVVVARLVEEEAVVDLEGAEGGCWGGKMGSGGGDRGLGVIGVPFCVLIVSVRGNAWSGGVHCVPASLVCADEEAEVVG